MLKKPLPDLIPIRVQAEYELLCHLLNHETYGNVVEVTIQLVNTIRDDLQEAELNNDRYNREIYVHDPEKVNQIDKQSHVDGELKCEKPNLVDGLNRDNRDGTLSSPIENNIDGDDLNRNPKIDKQSDVDDELKIEKPNLVDELNRDKRSHVDGTLSSPIENNVDGSPISTNSSPDEKLQLKARNTLKRGNVFYKCMYCEHVTNDGYRWSTKRHMQKCFKKLSNQDEKVDILKCKISEKEFKSMQKIPRGGRR